MEVVKATLRRWDPIGVIPELIESGIPPNEYDGYAPHILGMLQRGCTAAELQAHLEFTREETMGMGRAFPDTTAAAKSVATDLVLWWQTHGAR